MTFRSDWLIGNATGQSTIIDTATVTNASTFSGQTSFGGFTYRTNVTYVSGLLQNTSIGINHNNSVPVNGANAIDGLVAVMAVSIVQRPASSSSSCVYYAHVIGVLGEFKWPLLSAAWTPSIPRIWQLPVALPLAVSLLVAPLAIS